MRNGISTSSIVNALGAKTKPSDFMLDTIRQHDELDGAEKVIEDFRKIGALIDKRGERKPED